MLKVLNMATNDSRDPKASLGHRDHVLRSTTVKDEEAQLSIHKPLTRVALILDLVESPQVPLAITLTAPERVIIARIGRLDLPRAVRPTLRRDPAVLHLYVLTGSGMCMSVCLPGWSWRCSGDWYMAVGHVVGGGSCGWSGRVDVGGVTVCWHRVIV